MIWLGLFPACVQKNSENRNPPKKVFLSENMIFGGFRLSLDHFGQQAPKSPVSLLQNGVSTSSLPPFIVDLSAFQDFPWSNSFFRWEFFGVLKGKPRERLSMGQNSSENCVFRIEINRKCCNKQWQQFLRTAWFSRVQRNFHFLFWSLLFELLKHQHVAPPFQASEGRLAQLMMIF